MKRVGFGIILLLALSVLLGCGMLDTVTGGGDSFTATAELWSDVPRMDGLTPSELEDLPLPVKLLMRTIFGNLGRLNAEGEDQTTGNIDWISYNLSGTPQDVENFYTPEAMAAGGWVVESSQACASGTASGIAEAGTFCGFNKNVSGVEHLLAIIATQNGADQPTSVFFLRLEIVEGTTQ